MKLSVVNGKHTVSELGKILFQSDKYDEAVAYINIEIVEANGIQEWPDEDEDDEDFSDLLELCE